MSKKLSPNKIYESALSDMGANVNPNSLKLLKSGLTFLQERQKESIRKNELFAINSLISYKAYEHKTCETTVASIFQSKFNIDTIQNLPSHRFQHAIDFLIDLEMDKIIN